MTRKRYSLSPQFKSFPLPVKLQLPTRCDFISLQTVLVVAVEGGTDTSMRPLQSQPVRQESPYLSPIPLNRIGYRSDSTGSTGTSRSIPKALGGGHGRAGLRRHGRVGRSRCRVGGMAGRCRGSSRCRGGPMSGTNPSSKVGSPATATRTPGSESLSIARWSNHGGPGDGGIFVNKLVQTLSVRFFGFFQGSQTK